MNLFFKLFECTLAVSALTGCHVQSSLHWHKYGMTNADGTEGAYNHGWRTHVDVVQNKDSFLSSFEFLMEEANLLATFLFFCATSTPNRASSCTPSIVLAEHSM